MRPTFTVKNAPRVNAQLSMMASKGMDQEIFPPFSDKNRAILIQNYFVHADGSLIKRKGAKSLYDTSGTGFQVLERWKDQLIVAYGTTVARYNPTTNTFATIKTDFTAGTTFYGEPYGDYFFITSSTDGTFRIDYATFTAASTSVPSAQGMTIIDNRMYIWNDTVVQYSDVDTGSDPPFEDWNDGVDATEGGFIYNNNKGDVVRVTSLGQFIIIFYTDGKTAYAQDTIDSSGVLVKVDNIFMDRIDMGGDGAVLSTINGLFYVNEGGIYALISVGQPNIPFSDQETKHSQILGNEYFANIDFSNSDMMYDPLTDTLFITCARSSAVNNLVITYNLQNKAFTEIIGWNIARFINVAGVFYGVSAVNGKIYKLFSGYTDDGAKIGTDFIQELKLGSLTNLHTLYEFYANASLWPSSSLSVTFRTFDRTGMYDANAAQFTWTANNTKTVYSEYGSAIIGAAAWGGGYTSAGVINCLNGCEPMLRNRQRVQIRITSNDLVPHEINFFEQHFKATSKIRVREMTRV